MGGSQCKEKEEHWGRKQKKVAGWVKCASCVWEFNGLPYHTDGATMTTSYYGDKHLTRPPQRSLLNSPSKIWKSVYNTLIVVHTLAAAFLGALFLFVSVMVLFVVRVVMLCRCCCVLYLCLFRPKMKNEVFIHLKHSCCTIPPRASCCGQYHAMHKLLIAFNDAAVSNRESIDSTPFGSLQ